VDKVWLLALLITFPKGGLIKFFATLFLKVYIYILVMKIVVFDLDETLGYFTEFGMFLDCIANYLKKTNQSNLSQEDFNSLLDLYPEFLRPNIINILKYLKTKKNSGECDKIMIYTNNNMPREWCEQIIEYFETKISSKLFDQIIAAFKINGKQVEKNRTTYNKTHDDLIRCTKLPKNTEICFLDDILHPGMVNENIYYINIKPYYYSLSFEEMLERFLNSTLGKKYKNEKEFEMSMMAHWKLYNYKNIQKDKKEYELDKIVGKHIITHLQRFFNDNTKRSKTIKRKINTKNKTYKKFN
jgi:hypothetical protein